MPSDDPYSNHSSTAADSRPPLVLLHGVARKGSDFRPLLPWFDSWRVILRDHRGHGSAARGPGNYRVIDYADDVVGWLRNEVREPCILYGHLLHWQAITETVRHAISFLETVR